MGCGIPSDYANLQKGDTVLDLGSGAGNDCFVARSFVGEQGFVYGIDFSKEMIKEAPSNAAKLGYSNMKFIRGDIEGMPFEANKMDKVLSNCVLNLVPDKRKAFSEIYRVLKPTGSFCISDVVTVGNLPDALLKSAEMYAGCVAGATSKDEYIRIIKNSGFKDIHLRKEKEIILLGAAPYTAMVFVWSYLTDGDPNYTLVQVSLNDLIILVAYIPIVGILLGITNVTIPYGTLLSSILIFVVIPLVTGVITQKRLIWKKGEEWFRHVFLPKFKPVSIIALLTTLVLLFAFQGERIIEKPLLILLAAVPLVIQSYFIFFIAWYGLRFLKLRHDVKAPAAMIGGSNFFELAVAVAIALFGLQSPAAMVTVVGVLVEVPVMLSLVAFANRHNGKKARGVF